MASSKSYPVFYSVLGIFAVAALAAGWGIYDRGSVAKKSTAQLVQKRNELRSLQSVNPVPSEASKAAVEADLARTEVALGKMREELRGVGPVAEALRKTPVPTEPTDVFFNLETFVENMRRQAQAAEIKLKDNERFGFAIYSTTGPERDLIPQVFRQRLVSEYLLKALFEAKPKELVSLQRERPLTKAQQASGQPLPPLQANSGQGPSDFFEIDRRISARVPGFVDAVAFRIGFVGETASLRSLLNKLATFELPLVVRSVEVEPLPAASAIAAAPQANTLASIFGTAASPTPAEAPKPKPLVEKVLSRFTVTVELIDLVEAPATEATPTN